MSDLIPPAPKPTSRQNISTAKELAAAMLPVLVERLGVQTMLLNDPEVTGKALDRLSKLAGATEDKGTSNLPVIHFNISSSGAQVSVKSKKAAKTVPADVVDAEPAALQDSEPDAITIDLDSTPVSWASGLFGAEDE